MPEFTVSITTATGPHPLATITTDEPDAFDVLVGYLRAVQDERANLPPDMRAFRPPLTLVIREVEG